MHRVHIAGTTHPFQSFFQDNNQEAAWGNDTANGEDQVHGRYVHTVCGIVEVCTYITIYRGLGKFVVLGYIGWYLGLFLTTQEDLCIHRSRTVAVVYVYVTMLCTLVANI